MNTGQKPRIKNGALLRDMRGARASLHILLLVPMAVALCGCANTSSTKIRREADGTISIDSAKALAFDRLEYERRTTNGTERILIVNYRSEPVPAVTDAQGKREAAVIEKAGGAVGTVAGAALKATVAP